MQLPCVATNIRGCREEIVDGECGALIPPKDSQALARAITFYLENPAQAERTAAAARTRVEKYFDSRKVLQHQVHIYNRLTARLRD